MGFTKKERALYYMAETELLNEKVKGFIDINSRLPDIMDESRLLDEISEDLITEKVKELRDKSTN